VSNEAVNMIRNIQTGSAPSKAVLWVIADMANADLKCWPSVATLSHETCLHRTSVVRALGHLAEHGIIAKEPKHCRATTYIVQSAFVPRSNISQSRRATGSGERPVAESDRVGSGERPSQSRRATESVAESDSNRQGTTKEPPIEPAAAARASWPDDDEDVEAAIESYLKVAGGLFVNSTVRADLTAAVEGHGLDAVQKVIRQIGSENRRIVKSGWIGDRLKRGDHNQQPMKRGRRNDPVTDQDEMMRNIDAMEAQGWKIAGRP